MYKYSPGGYSWLCVAPEPKKKRAALSNSQKRELAIACLKMGTTLEALEIKVQRYQTVCKNYETVSGTKKGETVLKQIDAAQAKCEELTQELLDLFEAAGFIVV